MNEHTAIPLLHSLSTRAELVRICLSKIPVSLARKAALSFRLNINARLETIVRVLEKM